MLQFSVYAFNITANGGGFSIFIGLNSFSVPFVVSGGSFDFQTVDEFLFGPSAFFGDVSDVAELASGFQSDGFQGVGDDDFFLGVETQRNSVEAFQSAEGDGSFGSGMRQHAADGSPNLSAGRSVMERSLFGVCAHSFSQEVHVFQFVAEVGTGDQSGFASHDDDFLSQLELFGDVTGESAE